MLRTIITKQMSLYGGEGTWTVTFSLSVAYWPMSMSASSNWLGREETEGLMLKLTRPLWDEAMESDLSSWPSIQTVDSDSGSTTIDSTAAARRLVATACCPPSARRRRAAADPCLCDQRKKRPASKRKWSAWDDPAAARVAASAARACCSARRVIISPCRRQNASTPARQSRRTTAWRSTNSGHSSAAVRRSVALRTRIRAPNSTMAAAHCQFRNSADALRWSGVRPTASTKSGTAPCASRSLTAASLRWTAARNSGGSPYRYSTVYSPAPSNDDPAMLGARQTDVRAAWWLPPPPLLLVLDRTLVRVPRDLVERRAKSADSVAPPSVDGERGGRDLMELASLGKRCSWRETSSSPSSSLVWRQKRTSRPPPRLLVSLREGDRRPPSCPTAANAVIVSVELPVPWMMRSEEQQGVWINAVSTYLRDCAKCIWASSTVMWNSVRGATNPSHRKDSDAKFRRFQEWFKNAASDCACPWSYQCQCGWDQRRLRAAERERRRRWSGWRRATRSWRSTARQQRRLSTCTYSCSLDGWETDCLEVRDPPTMSAAGWNEKISYLHSRENIVSVYS